MVDTDLKGKYLELRKRHTKLPKYDDINEDFELEFLDKDCFISKLVRRRMNDKLIFFCRVLEGILYPNPQSHINAYESSFFSEDEKNELSEFYKKLMIFERRSLILDIGCTEDEDVKHIIELFNEWKEFRKVMVNAGEKMRDIWKTESKKVSEGGYFG